MRWKAGLPMILALTLTGCGAAMETDAMDKALDMRTEWLAGSGIQTTCDVTADYGDLIYTYSLRMEGQAESGSLTVLQPEELAGASVSWWNEELLLTYDGVSLETGDLSEDGLSPTDGLPLVLTAIDSGGILDAWFDTMGEEELLVVLIANPDPDYSEESTVTLWADPKDYALRQASVAWEGREVLRFDFSEFSFCGEESS